MKPTGSPHDRPLVLIHPPSMSRRFLPTRFLPHGMAVVYASLAGLGRPVAQYDFLMDSLYAAPDGLDVHGRDRDLAEAEYRAFLSAGTGSPRLAAFSEKYVERLPREAALYAFSVVSYHQFLAARLLASVLRRRDSRAFTVFGGPFVTVKPLSAFRDVAEADFWITGDGREGLAGLYHWTRGGPFPEDAPGLCSLAPGRDFANAKASAPASTEPPPDFTGLGLNDYRYDHPLLGPDTLFLPYRLTKGCPSACSFCTGRLVDSFSAKTTEKVVSELASLAERYQSRAFVFTDASVNGDPGLLQSVCRLLPGAIPGMRWYAYARVRGFTPELARLAGRAGCFRLYFGVESAHPPTIRLLGKGFSLDDLHEAISAAREAGIVSVAHLMINTPHETEADVRALADFVGRYAGDPMVEIMAQRFLLEPDTLMHRQPDRFGLDNLRPLPVGMFEREQFAYDIADGPDHAAIMARHAAHRIRLAPILESIEERLLPKDQPRTAVLRDLM